jgi:hypothetical protein
VEVAEKFLNGIYYVFYVNKTKQTKVEIAKGGL